MSSVQQELMALDGLQPSNLTIRTSTISIPSDKLNINVSDYYNDSNIIAVDGIRSGKRLFCLLVGEIPGTDVPDPTKHVVQLFMYKDFDESTLPDNEMMPKSWPVKLAGFAMLQLDSVPDTPQPTTKSPTGQYPELSDKEARFFGTTEGGLRIGPDGNTEIITGDGTTVSFGENVDLGAKPLTSTKDGFSNWLMVKNGFRDGSWLGAPLPNVVPLFPLTYDPFPNIPGIAELYLKVQMYKQLIFGVRDLVEEMSN